ncbi:1,4-dihydroxy-2-naphthoate octaprenyltransferase [Bacteroidia bacterium]|nr:1,4-dihydroxy-2-naphthoate octaprenyltransferase [Bacteroidia bacterium]
MVACALAYHDDVFSWKPALICLVFALLMQIISNLANDYFDYRKGSDNDERLGPKRAVAEGWISPQTMLSVTLGLCVLAGITGLLLVFYGGWQLIIAGFFIVLFALAYSGGPYPLAYHGWGDVCVLLFFGIVPVGFTYYVQALRWTTPATICGISVGLVIINILVANNYRDRFSDKRAGKKTTIVLFGEKFGSYFYLFNGIVTVLLCQYFWLEKAVWAALLPVLFLFPHVCTWREMVVINQGERLISLLEKTARNVLIFGILFAIGLTIH